MSDLQERIESLQRSLDNVRTDEKIIMSDEKASMWCFTTEGMISIAAPIITFMVLYLWSPSFVMSDDKLNWGKVMVYVVGVSIVVWGAVYLYGYCKKCD